MPKFQLSQEAAAAMSQAVLHDRLAGCIFGSALGDAIGLYTEFLSGMMSERAYPTRKFTFLPASEATPFRRDSHRSPHLPGEWTDDTDHALLILLAYLHADGNELDTKEFAKRLDIWVKFGLRALDTLPLGLGRTVGAIVRNKAFLEDPEAAARRHWTIGNYHAAPNGSLMRTHPLGLMCLEKTVEETFEVAASYSVVTHVDPRCIISCAIGTALIRGLVLGEVSEEGHVDKMIDDSVEWWAAYRLRQMQDESRKEEPDLDIKELRRHASVSDMNYLQLDEGQKIGYVYKTFGAGIHCLRLAMRKLSTSGNTLRSQVEVFEPIITNLIMRGGDADTNACFAGALVGSYIGYKALPPHWRDGLQRGDWLMEKTEALSKVVGITSGTYSGKADKDTAADGGRGMPTEKDMEMRVMLIQARMAKEEQEYNRKQREEEAKQRGSKWMSWLK